MTAPTYEARVKRLGPVSRVARALGLDVSALWRRIGGESPVRTEAELALRWLEEHPEEVSRG